MPKRPVEFIAFGGVPDFGGRGESTPVATDNVLRRGTSGVSIAPGTKTSRLGITLTTIALIAIVPWLVTFLYLITEPYSEVASGVLAVDVGLLVTLAPVVVFVLMMNHNRITIDTQKMTFKYRNGLGKKVEFVYSMELPTEYRIVYFANTSAKSFFNRNGWACFYRNEKMLFRLNMDRWDWRDISWLAENLRSKVVYIEKARSVKYVEKHYPGYFPMYATMPNLSKMLVTLAGIAGLVIVATAWIAVTNIYS